MAEENHNAFDFMHTIGCNVSKFHTDCPKKIPTSETEKILTSISDGDSKDKHFIGKLECFEEFGLKQVCFDKSFPLQ